MPDVQLSKQFQATEQWLRLFAGALQFPDENIAHLSAPALVRRVATRMAYRNLDEFTTVDDLIRLAKLLVRGYSRKRKHELVEMLVKGWKKAVAQFDALVRCLGDLGSCPRALCPTAFTFLLCQYANDEDEHKEEASTELAVDPVPGPASAELAVASVHAPASAELAVEPVSAPVSPVHSPPLSSSWSHDPHRIEEKVCVLLC
jgi:hypothetical protein